MLPKLSTNSTSFPTSRMALNNMNNMDNTRTALHNEPSYSSNETIAEDPQATTNTSSTDSFSSYCSNCPKCNLLDTNSANVPTYGTFILHSHDNTHPPKPTFFEASIEACSQILCCASDRPPPSAQTSECSSTPYPSSLSSYSYSYVETETVLSQDQTSEAETAQAQSLPRHDDGYKGQEMMRSTKDESIGSYSKKSSRRFES